MSVNGNLATWNRLKTPPTSALKAIAAGRLKGKSDINPQWRIQALTEEFGPYGIGWYITVDRKWSEPGSEGQVCVFADVSLYVKYPGSDEWAHPAPGTGGNMIVEMESKGLHTSDEGYKMAITDAISTAAKLIGLAADVYLGNFDGSKYTGRVPASDSPRAEAPSRPSQPSNGSGQGSSVKEASDKQVKMMFAISHKLGINDAVKDAVHGIKEKRGFIPMEWASKQIDRMQAQLDGDAGQAADQAKGYSREPDGSEDITPAEIAAAFDATSVTDDDDDIPW